MKKQNIGNHYDHAKVCKQYKQGETFNIFVFTEDIERNGPRRYRIEVFEDDQETLLSTKTMLTLLAGAGILTIVVAFGWNMLFRRQKVQYQTIYEEIDLLQN